MKIVDDILFYLSDMIFYLVVANDTTFTVILLLFILLALTSGIFALISHKNKNKQLKLLRIAYLAWYGTLAFALPLFLVWWFAALVDLLLIFITRKFYEKESIRMHFQKIQKSEDPQKYMSKLPIVLILSFVSYMFGLLLFLMIT